MLNKYDPWVSIFRLSRWLCQGNVFTLIFALVQNVALFLQWSLAQLLYCSLGRQCRSVFSLSFLDIYEFTTGISIDLCWPPTHLMCSCIFSHVCGSVVECKKINRKRSQAGMSAWCERYCLTVWKWYGNGTTVYWTVRNFFHFYRLFTVH